MSRLSLEIEELSKWYRIGVADELPETLAETIVSWIRAPFASYRRLRRLTRIDDPGERDVIRALDEVSFRVDEGQVVGIIGRNGAGKSTLLKVLAGITRPSRGQATIRGRVGSLLEVGTGFHPDLTGRENLYLNATILGMRRSEVDAKLERIVEFAEIGGFLDTPIKRYSSGMQIRLAFSVAAHLEPEILLVDEVLAVGDVAFQRKCLGRMGDIAGAGRTVLFVSHNMGAVEALCERVIVLEEGRVAFDGDPAAGIERYLGDAFALSPQVDLSELPRSRSEWAPVLRSLRILDREGAPAAGFRLGDDVVFEVELDAGSERYSGGSLSIALFSGLGQVVTILKSDIQTGVDLVIEGRAVVRCVLHDLRLAPGTYTLTIAFSNRRVAVDEVREAAAIEVRTADIHGSGQAGRIRGGFLVASASWEQLT